MEYWVDSAKNRMVSGSIMTVVGTALLAASYFYRRNQDWSEIDPLAEPVLEGLSTLLALLPVAVIAGGLTMFGWGLRRAARERRESACVDHHEP